MNESLLRSIFQSKFDIDKWREILINVFGAGSELRVQPEQLDNTPENTIGEHLGSITMTDGLLLGLFYYKVSGPISKKKVALRNLVSSFINQKYGIFDAALAVFDNGKEWRVSFITDIKGNATNPKRYTFVFGNLEHGYRTAIERFMGISPLSISLKTLKDAFSVDKLTSEFYKDLFNWYQWALSDKLNVHYPNNANDPDDDRSKNSEHLLRLITRLMFVWFIKQKNFVPSSIFDETELKKILKDFDATSYTKGNYYNAILQNLFFACLNKKITEREFASDGGNYGNEHYGVKTLFRDNKKESWFIESQDKIKKLFSSVPFLNGGLFECLDKDTPDSNGKIFYYDGFSRDDNKQKRAFIPNILFFGTDVSAILPSDNKSHLVSGIIKIFSNYNFTIEENTPNDVAIALDPELLGKVFENLLAAYNPETGETARKATGSFYTPREIVDYMVETSLSEYLKDKKDISSALRSIKIFDPACGSGAFPMGLLNAIIEKLHQIEPDIDIYQTKLDIIKNCIYGVDIQPIAVQISKLRFFISLVCEQNEKNNNPADNYGIAALPNLETKFVAANTLVDIKQLPTELNLFEDKRIEEIKKELELVRQSHFSATTAKEKAEFRKQDKKLRDELVKLLEENKNYAPEYAYQLALWNPYDQNSSSPFFNTEWMFGIKDGFDIVIGNPPYVQLQKLKLSNDDKKNGKPDLQELYKSQGFKTYAATGDLYCLFYEHGIELLKDKGHLCFITSNKWMRAGYGESLRDYLSKQNPKILIDLGGNVFESATVDTNILLVQRAKNEGNTISCTIKDRTKNMSDLIRSESQVMTFTKEPWVILSPIEQSIKAKIEKYGTPLKDWDISINYGIKTGCNEAFIISKEKKDELITKDPKSAEIIRPILRGRDIKRYGYEFADLWLIATHNGYKDVPRVDINKYPAVKEWLNSHWEKISKREDKGDTPYNLRNCAYLDDFNKPKIIYQELSQGSRFAIDNHGKYFISNTAYLLTGKHLHYLLRFLNSKIIEFVFRNYYSISMGTGLRWLNQYVITLPIIIPSKEVEKELLSLSELNIEKYIANLYHLSDSEMQFISDSVNS
ncbi:MAG: Eco57I restriction-modification methylase domain-containing protein [Alphaproteobacteria bacterium]|jgi:hypothetical protein